MLKIQTLSSGSAGNITYIGSSNTGILVDVGLSLSMTLKLMAQANIDPHSITALVITHEHSDHIKGAADFVTKYNVPVYIYNRYAKTLRGCLKLPPHHFVETESTFTIGDITVSCFPVSHDSKFCLGYTFQCGNAAVGIATDIGQMTDIILANLARCQVVVLESNHDIQKLNANKDYPDWLKRRILGNRGHLSNIDCGRAISKLYQAHVSQVILGHLSEKNNTPLLAYETVKQFLATQGITEGKDIYIDVALQSKIGNCYCLE
ncbi:MAG: MBL fold metallo-hydrolase [Eubacteriales bacterium]|nr:MBL fold metallo-hydrolase [Eubacteriales bacterium]